MNKNYKRGYNDGFEDGINEQRNVVDVLNEKLDKELEINKNIRIKADNARKDAENAREEAETARKEADEQKLRIDDLKKDVEQIQRNINELEMKYLQNNKKISDYENEVIGLDLENAEIRKVVKALSGIDGEYAQNTLLDANNKKAENCKIITTLNTEIWKLRDKNKVLESRIGGLRINKGELIYKRVMSA